MTILKSTLFLFNSVWRAIFTLLFIGSLFVNVTMFAWSAGAVALSSAFKAVTGITTVIDNHKRQVTRVSKRIATRTSRSVARSVVSIPAEAIPYFGVATIITITGLEINDACATMKDIKELNGLLDTAEDIDTGTVCGLKVPDLDIIMDQLKLKKEPYMKP